MVEASDPWAAACAAVVKAPCEDEDPPEKQPEKLEPRRPAPVINPRVRHVTADEAALQQALIRQGRLLAEARQMVSLLQQQERPSVPLMPANPAAVRAAVRHTQPAPRRREWNGFAKTTAMLTGGAVRLWKPKRRR